jgi:hypothetical protein
MTVNGDLASANLLIIPYATHGALALMLLRRAANLPIDPADREKPAFLTAASILFAAQQQSPRTRPTSPLGRGQPCQCKEGTGTRQEEREKQVERCWSSRQKEAGGQGASRL